MGNHQPKPDAEEFAARLNEVLDAMGVPGIKNGRAVWLARKYEVSKPTASGWIGGHYLPIPDRVRSMAAAGGVSFDWLYFGKGDKGGKVVVREPLPLPYVASQPMRDPQLTIALRLAADAIGRDLYLAPEEHTDLVMTLLDMLGEGLPEAKVLPIARRLAARLAHGGSDGNAGKGDKDPGVNR